MGASILVSDTIRHKDQESIFVCLKVSCLLQQSNPQELFYKYRQAATYLSKARESDWEIVFDMQHYGVPRSLEEQCPSCVRKVLLPETARIGALEFLQFSSLNELSIFPRSLVRESRQKGSY
jgi:hypothetical protein